MRNILMIIVLIIFWIIVIVVGVAGAYGADNPTEVSVSVEEVPKHELRCIAGEKYVLFTYNGVLTVLPTYQECKE